MDVLPPHTVYLAVIWLSIVLELQDGVICSFHSEKTSEVVGGVSYTFDMPRALLTHLETANSLVKCRFGAHALGNDLI